LHKWADREGIDGRNSATRKKTFFEIYANKFNDPSFQPCSNIYVDLHDYFLDSYDLFDTDEQSLPLVTPNKIKDQVATVRVKALFIICKWEQSRNDSGMCQETDEEFGHIVANQEWLGSGLDDVVDGDNRRIFLRSEKLHVLYYWQLFDENHLLSHSLCKLSDDVKVNSKHVPTISITPNNLNKN